MGRFLPPDHDAGDPNTIGGYQAVHARPAAFEGRDGASYSIEIVVDETGGRALRAGMSATVSVDTKAAAGEKAN